MVLDTNLTFCKDQAITASAISANLIDGKAVRDFGRGNEIYLNIYCTTIFTSTTANELSVQIVSSSGADPGSSDVFNTIFRRSSALLQQTGLVYRAPWPVGVPYERLGLYFLATTSLAAGKITAFLTLGGAEDQVLTT
jgi:hypothetical protein